MTGSLTHHETIAILLDNWTLIWDPCTNPHDNPAGTNDGTPHLNPLTRHHSIQELDRSLRQLREHHRLQYTHIRGYYDAPTRTAHIPRLNRDGKPIRRRQGNNWITDTQPELQRAAPPWVDKHQVQQGINTLASLYHGRCTLPDGFYTTTIAA